MPAYPLFYTFRHIKRTEAFVAGIEVGGRVLIEKRGDEWWMVAVEPGGFSERGTTIPEAFQAFRAAYDEVLEDLAAGSRNLDRLVANLREFLADRNVPATDRWDDAREQLRSGVLIPEAPLDQIAKDTTTRQPYLSVFDLSLDPPATLLLQNEVLAVAAANNDYPSLIGDPYPRLAA